LAVASRWPPVVAATVWPSGTRRRIGGLAAARFLGTARARTDRGLTRRCPAGRFELKGLAETGGIDGIAGHIGYGAQGINQPVGHEQHGYPQCHLDRNSEHLTTHQE
jgi:hypothetical protein